MCKEFTLVIQLLIKLQDTSTSPITPERVSGLDRLVFESHCLHEPALMQWSGRWGGQEINELTFHVFQMLSDFPLTFVAAQGHPQLNRLCNTVFIILMVSVKEDNIFDDLSNTQILVMKLFITKCGGHEYFLAKKGLWWKLHWESSWDISLEQNALSLLIRFLQCTVVCGVFHNFCSSVADFYSTSCSPLDSTGPAANANNSSFISKGNFGHDIKLPWRCRGLTSKHTHRTILIFLIW